MNDAVYMMCMNMWKY